MKQAFLFAIFYAMKTYSIENPSIVQKTIQEIYREIQKRAKLAPTGACPIELTADFVRLCYAQSCGKCVPCRDGLGAVINLLESIIDGTAAENSLEVLKDMVEVIADTADCAIGYEAASYVSSAIDNFKDDFENHIKNGDCAGGLKASIPCQEACPAHVNIPGYIALAGNGKYEEAMALIRKDNPFPSVCGYICEHPCEAKCRRHIIDDGVNICSIKRFASDHSKDKIKPPVKAVSTGKKIAVIGGGPAGLTAAYYLTIMGHDVTVFEVREKLGGMLRYGIPDYRLPQTVLDRDISYITDNGVKVCLNSLIDENSIAQLKKDYDAVYVSIGAHSDNKLGIEGEDAQNVISAVSLLRNAGSGNLMDMKGKRVCIIGGGNVAMDCTRTCLRLGAKDVKCVYRRRIEDMTALREEIDDAKAEGADIVTLYAPDHIEKDSDGKVCALWANKQIISAVGKDGRPGVKNADAATKRFACDYVVVAIGQAINSKPFESAGIPNNRGRISADLGSFVSDNVFAGGDAVSGPATVIKAVAAGKVAAYNIDKFLGFAHEIKLDISIPDSPMVNTAACGRVNTGLIKVERLNKNFKLVQQSMTKEECNQECSRCLRCDSFGLGGLKK